MGLLIYEDDGFIVSRRKCISSINVDKNVILIVALCDNNIPYVLVFCVTLYLLCKKSVIILGRILLSSSTPHSVLS